MTTFLHVFQPLVLCRLPVFSLKPHALKILSNGFSTHGEAEVASLCKQFAITGKEPAKTVLYFSMHKQG